MNCAEFKHDFKGTCKLLPLYYKGIFKSAPIAFILVRYLLNLIQKQPVKYQGRGLLPWQFQQGGQFELNVPI